MATYSIRCRNSACRHRRVARTHPDDYKVAPRCPVCDTTKGWRIEGRQFRRHQSRCTCSGPEMQFGRWYPHRTNHPLCDQHPHGFYNQARARGVAHEDIPEEYRPCLKEEPCL